jgi:hypothetical protein
MPELDDVIISLELFSLMAYPSDKDSRNKLKANRVAQMAEEWPELKEEHITQGKKPEEWSLETWRSFVKKYTNQLQNELEEIFSDSGGRPSLYNSPEYEKVMDEYQFNCYKGNLAGWVLIWIRRMAGSDLASGASVNKAVFLTEEITGRALLKATKARKWPLHQSFIRQDAWSGFKSVSPLWAAYIYWNIWGKPLQSSPFLLESIPRFLSLANNFRDFATTHFPRAQKKPTLLPEETWALLTDIQPMDISLEAFPLSETEREVLDSYKASG